VDPNRLTASPCRCHHHGVLHLHRAHPQLQRRVRLDQLGLPQAGVVLTMVPCIVLYLLLQRYYVGGLLSGALK
jgi:ABC-type glycerol-3-phosphate transport system permease component